MSLSTSDRIIRMMEKYNISMKKLAEYFNIPYRTIQDWKRGIAKCPEYVLDMMEKVLEYEMK